MLRKIFPFVLCLVALTGFIIGCSDDGDDSPTGPGGGSNSHNFIEFEQLIEEIAPPVYSGPTAAPGDPDSIWTDGQYALLGKVFGETEPMSLYTNIEALDRAVEMLQSTFNAFDSMGISGDTSFTTDSGMTVETESLTTITGIPMNAQVALGLSGVMLDRVFKNTVVWQGDTMYYHIGYIITPLNEVYLSWYSSDDGSARESNLYYASIDLADSSLDIRGVFYKEETEETASWAYRIETVDEADFAYKMAWYSDIWGDTTGVGSVIGGGNRDTLFAMRYRQWSPADASEYDTLYALEQMFDSAYTYLGTSIATGLEEHIVADSMLTYSSQPGDFIPSPWQ
ncbi:hypothetical protein GF377_02160 [candidate division GN15 bacterium]|nr:hypothetical protein [candidate division GN15 bacterium]